MVKTIVLVGTRKGVFLIESVSVDSKACGSPPRVGTANRVAANEWPPGAWRPRPSPEASSDHRCSRPSGAQTA